MDIRCQHCGVTFNNNIEIINARLDPGIFTTECTNCGKDTDLVQGTTLFDAKGAASLLARPEFTTEVLQKLKHVTEIAQREKYTPEKFKQVIASIGVPDTFWKLVIPENAGDFYGFLSFLATVIFGILALRATKVPTNKKTKKKKLDIETHKLRREYHKKKK